PRASAPRRRTSPPPNSEGTPVALPVFLTRLLTRTGLARLLPGVRRCFGDATAFLHYYSDRALGAPHGELREVTAPPDAHAPDPIALAPGARRLDMPPARREPERRGYPPPWGLPELREAVAGRLFADHGLTVSPAQQVLVTHGAAGALAAA